MENKKLIRKKKIKLEAKKGEKKENCQEKDTQGESQHNKENN